MAEQYDFDLIVIGSGPGGYVGAIRASQLGLRTAVVEKAKPGGVCLNIGCIPSKALIHQANLYLGASDLEGLGVKIDRSGLDYAKVYAASRKAADTLSRGVEFLFKKNNITLVHGYARLAGEHEVAVDKGEGGQQTLSARFILLATGSRPRSVPGFDLDEQTVISSDGFIMMQQRPQSLIILGSGYIGMECAHIASAFGTQVHVVEMLDAILPNEDADVVAPLTRPLRKRGVQFTYPARATGMRRTDAGVEVDVEQDGQTQTLSAERVLVAVGRAPNTEDVGLETLGIPTEKGFVVTGDYYQTKTPSIYAIGDIVPEVQLAHVASKQAEMAVEHMAGRPPREKKVDRTLIPMTIFTEPQIASFGLNEREAKKRGLEYSAATFPYRGIGKAVAVGHPDGFAKVLYHPQTREILGAQIVGADASEVIHEMLLGRRSELLPEDLATMIHAHPTISEVVMESMRAVEGWAIHA